MHVDRRSFVRSTVGMIPATFLLQAAGARGEREPGHDRPIRVRVWCEATAPRSIYPDDIDGALADQFSRLPGVHVSRGRLTDPEAGLSEPVLDGSDVIVWWGRLRHEDVPDDRAAAVVQRVRDGRLGFVALYASCGSKPFRQLMSMPCEPGSWREDGRPEFVSIKAPDHPIARGISPFTIPMTDMFSEPFAVPQPDSVVFVSTWEKGETLRSGLTWTIGKGRVTYLRTGPETYPVLFHPSIRQAISNAVIWTAGRS
ncbi:MAG: ThuA domain-containing protein [Isosphaeraceae bacterium]